MTTNNAARIVGPETVRMLALGHPWVVADAYTKNWPAGSSGQTVQLCDSQGCFLATALLDPQERIIARVLDRKRIQLDRAWLTERLRSAIAFGVEPRLAETASDHGALGHPRPRRERRRRRYR